MTFENVASKLQEELIDVILANHEINDYELIVYKYVFITELGIPLFEDIGIEICDDSFILYIIPDDLGFGLLRKLDDAFDKFKVTFMPIELPRRVRRRGFANPKILLILRDFYCTVVPTIF